MRVGLFIVLLTCTRISMGQDQQSGPRFVDGRPVSYSDMYIVEEEGDFIGWDLRVTKTSDNFRITLFCGEGAVEGPIHATFHLQNGIA